MTHIQIPIKNINGIPIQECMSTEKFLPDSEGLPIFDCNTGKRIGTIGKTIIENGEIKGIELIPITTTQK